MVAIGQHIGKNGKSHISLCSSIYLQMVPSPRKNKKGFHNFLLLRR